MSETKIDYQTIAQANGVDLDSVKPIPHDERLKILESILAREDVPYPIAPAERTRYVDAATRGEHFGIGNFNGETVDLRNFTNSQDYQKYTFEDHLSWACLVSQQQKTKHQFACKEYLDGEALFEISGGVIPDFYLLNARIYQQTQWQLATVSEIIPAELFFTCHSKRFFPVTTFMRPLGTDYLEEPDIGHDVAGHVATFTIPAVADVMKNHGETRNLIYAERDEQITAAGNDPEAVARIQLHADELLMYAGRIYWFTVEFGLVMENGQVRDFGAGILSSPGETVYSIGSPESNRILIDPSDDADLMRLANTDYLISEFQKTYFILESFDLLQSLTPERILDASKKAMSLPDFTWREIAPGDRVMDVGSKATSPNEKYYRLMAGQEMDECLHRTAIKNLTMHRDGISDELLAQFRALPPEIPASVMKWFRETYPN
ncbi:MAG: phenylalanine-4-hydroxylase [Mariniblastus sp.]|jgi:phenylalanine-4-hydroxylase